jgi:serine/threonine-protein kinase
MSDYNEAIRLDPKNAGAYRDLAWILATSPADSVRNAAQAVAAATRACDLTDWTEWHALKTLAAAYAEAADFDLATQYQVQAMASLSASERELTEMQRHLALFLQHKAVHEAAK